MQMKRFAAAVLIASALAGACVVHQTDVPPLSGPSDVSTSMAITANPDTIKLGVSPFAPGDSAQIVIQVFNTDGTPSRNRVIRLDILVGSAFVDCGTLASHDLVTGSDGRAVTVFTAPAQPPWMPQPECGAFTPGNTVTIVASVIGTNAQVSIQRTAQIRMLLPTIIQNPGSIFVNFTISPPTAKVTEEITFADSGSMAAIGCSITGYQWTWSDGIKKTGPVVMHDFSPAGTYTATLTVTDSCGNVSAKSASVVITN
jgi:chitodextrinase